MSVKRGLTRIYVVLWTIWGIGLGTYAGINARNAWQVAAPTRFVMTPDGTVSPFPAETTDQSISATLHLQKSAAPPDTLTTTLTITGAKRFFMSPGRPSAGEWLEVVTGGLAADPEGFIPDQPAPQWFEHKPARELVGSSAWRWHRTLEMLGLWLGLGGLAPGALLLAVRWVWVGFERRA